MFLLFQIGRRWSEAMMHGWGSYYGHVPNHLFEIPSKKSGLDIPALNNIGRCAMLS